MKVIRLVEAGITVNDLKAALKSPYSEKRNASLKDYFDKIGHYGGNTAANIYTVLQKFDIDFIKYFFKCLGYEKLSDRNNLILTALASDSAPNLINGDKLVFTTLFNLVNNAEHLNITAEYLSDPNALIYYRDLYKKVKDQDSIEGLIISDVNHAGNSAWRASVKNAINTGEYGQFVSSDNVKTKQESQATKFFKEMPNDKKVKWLKQAGVKEQTAKDAVNQINNEIINR